MITTSNFPPQIKQSFDKFLLMTTLERTHWNYCNKIVPLAVKKLINCPGRQREFDKLMDEWEKIYGIKKNEEAHYEAKRQEKIKKRSSISTSEGTMQFKRIRSSQ